MPYPFDPTGKSTKNLVIGETRLISLPPGRVRLFAIPLNGPYFADSLVIKYTPNTGQERVLSEGVDYVNSFQYLDAASKINAPVFAGISFNDLTLNGTITYNYQCLGTTYSIGSAEIATIETTSTVDPRFTAWENVVTLPAVPVADYTWTSVNVDDVHKAVRELDKVGLVAHLRPAFLQEPGQSVFIPTAQEVGLGQVPNYPPATEQQALDGTSDAALMTPLKTAMAVESEVTRQLANVGYLVPLEYTGGINIVNDRTTVKYNGEVFVVKQTSLPHVTSGIWATDSVNFTLFRYAEYEKWDKTYITVTGNEPVTSVLGKTFIIDVEHDSRVVPQLVINDIIFTLYPIDFKVSADRLYVNYPVAAGDKLVLFTKRSLLSVNKDTPVIKLFEVVDNTSTFPVGDIVVDKENLRVTLNDFIILNEQQGDYSITNGVLTIYYRLAVGDVIEVETIDSAFIFGKNTLRNILAI